MKIRRILRQTCVHRFPTFSFRKGIVSLLTVAALALAGNAQAQLSATLVDYGATDPTPGANDASQLTFGGGNPDGLNYYFDNGNPPGQTFTTGANPNGYVMDSVYIRTAGNSGGLPGAGQAYTLRLYSVSGATATLLATYVSQTGFLFTDTDWLQWTNLSFGLQPNTQYAYSLRRNSGGWENMANVTGNLYAGGEVALIPTAGGAITYGSSHNFDATFDIAMTPATVAFANPPAIAPAEAVTVGTTATISTVAAVGPGPLSYQWQTDGGSGGALTNIPGANGISVAVNTTGYALGVYNYAVVVTNSTSSSTSAVVSLTVFQDSTATLADVGTTITPGVYDISQLTGGGNGDGVNYYNDNSQPPGQTFTTGTNQQGYFLSSVTIGTGGGGNSGTATLQGYALYIYSVNGSTATLLARLTNSSFAYTYGDWLKWDGFTPILLKSNSVYAYAFRRSTTGWAGMTSTPNTTDVYTNGQLCLIPTTGGTITFGNTGMSDAAFDLGLTPIGVGPSPYPFANTIQVSPSAIVVAGTSVTLSESATGNAPLFYQWRTDGGSGGTLTNIPGATATNFVLNTTGWTPKAYRYDVLVTNSFGAATSIVSTITVTYANTTALLEDIGSLDPQPLVTDDISQLTLGGGNPDGMNYYLDNGAPPGQTFVTGSNPGGYTLTSLAIRTGTGSTGQLPAGGQAYILRIYSISGNSAVLYATYTSQTNFTFTHTDWLRWAGLVLPLSANTTYAYSFARVATGTGWENMSSSPGNPYGSGEAVLIPPSGGTMTLGSSHDYDGTFILGFATPGYPNVSPATLSSRTVFAGSPVTASATVTGPGSFTYQWETDGGNSGTMTNIPSATSTTLPVDTTGLDGLNVAYRLVAANGSGTTTGEVALLIVNAASAPVIVTDTTPSPANRFIGGNVTFSASFTGTLPLSYQWQVDKGSGATNIVGQTNVTLTLTNLQVADSGSYSLMATNIVGPGNSTPATLTVYPNPASPVTVNFQWHSTEGGDAGTYSGAGIPGLGSGTYWNQVTGPATWTPGTYTSSGGLADDGTTDIGVSWTLVTAGSWSQTANPANALLESFAISYGTQNFTFNLPNGLYHLVLFSCNGEEAVTAANSATAFTVNGVAKVAVPTQHSSFVAGNNYVVFSNMVVTARTLTGTWSVTNGLSFGSLNGAQLRYLGQVNTTPTSIAPQVSGNQLTLNWPADHVGWTLQVQTNSPGAGLGTNWVSVPGSSAGNSQTLTVDPAAGSVFYRLVYP